MATEMRLIDANAFREFLEVIRQDYREEDTLSSGFAACLIETVQDEYLALAPTIDAASVVHGRWIAETKGTYIPVEFDESGNLIVHQYVHYKCSVCGRWERVKEPYCNCGAKMDLKEAEHGR